MLDVGIRVPARSWPGADGRTFLCVAGLGCSARDFGPVVSGLAALGGVVAIELVGVADGPRRRTAVIAAPIVRRIVAAHAEGETVLVGHSMGALVALRAAAAAPARFAAVILKSGFFPPSRNGRGLIAMFGDYARHRAFFAAGALERRRRPLDRGAVRAPPLTPLRTLAPLGLRSARFHALADPVACPVLVVHGACDHHVPVAFARAAARRHPRRRLEEIARAGHFPHRESPGEWLAAVRPWFATAGVC